MEAACLDCRSGGLADGDRRLRRRPAEAVPAKFWGVVPQAPPTAEQFQRLKRGGVDSVRIPIGWSAVQPTQGGPIDWGGIDNLVRGATSAGPRGAALPQRRPELGGRGRPPLRQPGRRCRSRPAPSAPAGPTSSPQAVLRYGPNGSFWAENPGVPKRPIRTWQIWNEENFKYFVARPNPADYGKLVNLSYAAIKGVDPGAQLILGGMFATPIEATFKKKPAAGLLRHRLPRPDVPARRPGIKAKFNGIALHPYTGSYKNLTEKIEDVRAVLKKTRRRRQEALDHRARLELRPARLRRQQLLRPGPGGPGEAAQGRLQPARAQPGEVEAGTGLLVLGRRRRRAPATSATAPASSPKASSRRSPGSPT